LLESDKAPTKKSKINPKDNHISFQCSDMNLVIKELEEKNIEYVTAVVEEGGITVDQLFFHDPDGYMVEICNCQNLPVLPLPSCPLIKAPKPSASLASSPSLYGRVLSFLLLRPVDSPHVYVYPKLDPNIYRKIKLQGSKVGSCDALQKLPL
jgi:hypothetical protein